MVEISLTKSLRSTVSTLTWVNQESAAANERLTSGVKVQTALDDPSTYISAKGLSIHAAALDKYLERLTQGLGVIGAADNGITSITKSLDTLKGVVTRAAASKDAFERADLVSEYNEILDKIVETAKDASYGGKNLLLGPGNDLTLFLSNNQDESVTVKAADFTDLLNTLGLKKLDEGKAGTFETSLVGAGNVALKTTSKLTASADYKVGDKIDVKDSAGMTVKSLTVTADTTVGDLVTAFTLPDLGMRASLADDGVLTVDTAAKFTISSTRASAVGATSTYLDAASNPATTATTLVDTGQFEAGDIVTIRDGSGVAVGSLTVGAGTTMQNLMDAYTTAGLTVAVNAGTGELAVSSAGTFSIDNTRTSTVADLTATTPSAWVSRTSAEAAQQGVSDARKSTQKHATDIGLSLTLLKSRANFIESYSNTLGATAESMLASDKNEEAAIMLALDTQRQLALGSFSITQTADEGILRMLSGGAG